MSKLHDRSLHGRCYVVRMVMACTDSDPALLQKIKANKISCNINIVQLI